jgi:hypothetical protein
MPAPENRSHNRYPVPYTSYAKTRILNTLSSTSTVFARWAGSQLFVHLHVGVPESLTAFESCQLEEQIVAGLKGERKDVKEVQAPLGSWDLCVIIHIVFSTSHNSGLKTVPYLLARRVALNHSSLSPERCQKK